MKRVISSSLEHSSYRRAMGTRATPIALQLQRPDLSLEANGGGFVDLNNNNNNNFSARYKPSAPAPDLAHTVPGVGLGTNQATDPYQATLSNIATTAPSLAASNVSFGQTGAVSTVLMNSNNSAASLLQASTAANSKRQLSVEEIALLEKGYFTISEWIGTATQPAAVDAASVGAAGDASSTTALMGKTSNGLLKVYTENFLKIDVPLPVSTVSVGYISHFEKEGLAALCLEGGRADVSVVTEQWKSIVRKFTTISSSQMHLVAPEKFLAELEAIEREALLFTLSIVPSSSSSSSKASDADTAAAAPLTAASTTEALLEGCAEGAVLAVKALISGAIEAHNHAIDTTILPLVSNAVFFDEGNAVWRVLLRTFDAEKRSIFVGSGADSLADSPQLAAYEWVMSHDRPLPKVTAPVALLFLLSAVRAVAPVSLSTAAVGSSSSSSSLLLDAEARGDVQKMNTLSRLSLFSDEAKADFVQSELDKLFSSGGGGGGGAISSAAKAVNADGSISAAAGAASSATALLNNKNTNNNNSSSIASSSSSSVDVKTFLAELRRNGFDTETLSQVELLFTKADQTKSAELSRFKTTAGSADVGAVQSQTVADGAKNAAKSSSSSDEKSAAAETAAAAATNKASSSSAVVLNTNISKAAKAQIAPIVTLFMKSGGKGAAAMFQQLYKNLSSSAMGVAAATVAGASSSSSNVNNSEVLMYTSRMLGFGSKVENISTVFNFNNPKFAAFWAQNGATYAEAVLTDEKVLSAVVATVTQMLMGHANLAEGVVSKEGLKLLQGRLTSMAREGKEEAERAVAIRRVLMARQNVGKVVECLAAAGADVSPMFQLQEIGAAKIRGVSNSAVSGAASSPAGLAEALLTGSNASTVQEVGAAVIARHPEWAASGVIPADAAHFTADNMIAIAAHVFVRMSYVPHTTLALMKRNYRGRIGDVFVPEKADAASSDAQPRHQNLSVELGKVEFYDNNLYKRNDPQGWYQRMRDIHNRNISVKVDLKDLRTVSDDFAAIRGEFKKNIASSSTAAEEDGAAAASSSSTYNTNAAAGQQVYFGLQQERRLRVLAGERVGMDIIKLDADRFEDAADNERHGLVKLQQLLSDAKKTELGKAYWPSVEVKVRNPSGQSRSMQSLIDYGRIEAQSKDLYAQYREIKKKALFVSPMDLYLKDRSEEADANKGTSRSTVTSEGYLVNEE